MKTKDDSNNDLLICDFCGNNQYAVDKLIEAVLGRITHICGECVGVCVRVLEEDAPRKPPQPL